MSPIQRGFSARARAPAPSDPAEEPQALIREPLASAPELAAVAHDLARRHLEDASDGPGPTLRRATQRMAARAALHHAALVRLARSGSTVTPAGKWLLDNLHLSERIVPELLSGFSSRLERHLPRPVGGASRSLPLVYSIAERYIAHTDSHFTSDSFSQFLAAYQEVRPLKLRELSIVALCLKLACLENMTRGAARVVLRHQARVEANALSRAIAEEDDPDTAVALAFARLGTLRSDFVLLPFVVQLLRRLRETGVRAEPLVVAIGERLAQRDLTVDRALTTIHDDQIATTTTIVNIVGSLRALDHLDWSAFFERASSVDAILRRSESFLASSSPTRVLYRHAVEELASTTAFSEAEIAQAALDQCAGAHDAFATDVGYFLVGDGRPQLERAIGFRAPPRLLLRRLFLRTAAFNYLIPIVLLSWLIVLRPLAEERLAGASFVTVALITVLGLIAASELAVALVNRLITEAIGPRRLPRLDFSTGVPSDCRTMVAVPALLHSPAQIDELVARLEIHFLANSDDTLTFAIVSDFADAAAETLPTDDRLLAQARDRIAEVNRRHPRRDIPRFWLLHRRRLWNAAQGSWMGWERKRGKLHELNRLLRGAGDTSFATCLPSLDQLPRDTKFVVTLDADTQLAPNSVRELAATLAHPLNRPVVDLQSRRVVRGHGLLQPRITPLLPSAFVATRLQRLESMNGGLDPYAFAVSDVYQDLFGEGSYVGKGIYDLDAFETVLAGRIPENRVLSHDLLEGLFARTGFVSDIELFEEAPANYLVASGRRHRWIRGDWQLLPWIVGRVAGAHASTGSMPLPLIGWWKLLDNLRRSLVPPATVACLLAIWTLPLANPVALTLLLVACLVGPAALPVVVELGLSLVTSRERGLMARMARLARTAVAQGVLSVVMVAHEAWSASDAIARTLYRLYVSRQGLLEWTTAAQLEAAASRRLRDFHAGMAGSVVIAAASLIAMLALGTPALAVALPIVVGWLFAPAIAWWLSVPGPPERKRAMSAADEATLRDIAHDTWRFFERFVGADDNHLPPDNFQEDPEPVVAHRTSPTNIGLYLLATLAAREFGWITASAMAQRLAATLATIERLEKHRGHLFNWYDTRTLEPLPPRYVSSVDSGNLAAYLVVVQQACRAEIACELEAMPVELRRCLDSIATASDKLLRAMDFAFLIDPKQKLLAIGYRSDDAVLDVGCYDLLASEARLALFIAIIRGDVPPMAWFRLGRARTAINGVLPLLSWSGSMFEYLMPSLVTSVAHGSVLEETQRIVVAQQIAFGDHHGVPWGVSESAYNMRDLAHAYQYRAFGLPGLGLKPGLEQDLVIAPYATGLAAMFRPAAAVRNFAALARAGARGEYGFYEALDYTAARLPKDQRVHVVRAYMSHHQGMILVAIANTLLGDRFVDWFHGDPRVRAFELLLQERSPPGAAAIAPAPHDDLASDQINELALPTVRSFTAARHVHPVSHVLSNGRYCVMLTAAGGGYSRWRDVALTRWRDDEAINDCGIRLVVRDCDSGAEWSAGARPRDRRSDRYEVHFSEDHAEIVRHDEDIVTRLGVVVSAEDDVELRSLVLANPTAGARRLEVTFGADLALIGQADDEAHPAFGKLFVTTEFDRELSAVLASRRARSARDPRIWLAAVMVVEDDPVATIEFDTARASFVGRGRYLLDPAGVAQPRLAGQQGVVLDPVVALRTRVTVAPGGSSRIVVAMIVAASRADAVRLAAKYRDPGMLERAATVAWTRARIKLHHLGIQPDDANLFQQLASIVVFSTARRRPVHPSVGGIVPSPPSILWGLGISGDLPIVVVRAHDDGDLAFVQQMARCHIYWRNMLVDVDLVCVNERAVSYLQDFQERLEAVARAAATLATTESSGLRGRMIVLRRDLLGAAAHDCLVAIARIDFAAGSEGLAERLGPPPASARPAPGGPTAPAAGKMRAGRPTVLEFANGFGGFDSDGRRYVVEATPPLPWTNVIANPAFGFLVTESGGGYAWSQNSREHKLTPWSNDPIGDRPGEIVYLRDDDTGDIWSPTSSPAPIPDASYRTIHGRGFSRFECARPGLSCVMTTGVPRRDTVKITTIEIANTAPQRRRFSLTAYVEWVLGVARSATAAALATEFDAASGTFFAVNPLADEFAGRVAFVHLSSRVSGWTDDRVGFFGRDGDLARPQALIGTEPLRRAFRGALDPCAALQSRIEIAGHATASMVLLLGDASSRAEALELVARFGMQAAAIGALTEAAQYWDDVLGRVVVRTPDRAFDILTNHWLIYQALSCRVWARSGFYQAGGAYGFRDQLQDAMALAVVVPEIAREHLLRAAGRQFVEGDVQHWWHPPRGRGTRTRYSDDAIWLAQAVAHYVRVTGDHAVLDEQVEFLAGATLPAGEAEAYFEPGPSGLHASLYEHGALALDRGMAVGPHGLPLIGGGDWNDGMNEVGAGGKGESVWLGWFLIDTLQRFAALAEARDDREHARRWREHATFLSARIDWAAWDGAWYRRAYFDDGTPLGSTNSVQCRIDAIAQSWAVIAGGGDENRRREAMASLDRVLIDRRHRLIRLLTPPFDDPTPSPGYIAAYPPGIRENGGHYTHAAVWTAMAFAMLGDGDNAGLSFAMINPIDRTRSASDVLRYQLEPYAVAADIYSNPQHCGRGGWSWYTGSAGWLHRLAVEQILGLSIDGDRARIDPCIPSDWDGFELTYRRGHGVLSIRVDNPDHVSRGVVSMSVDGQASPVSNGVVLGEGEWRREVVLRLGRATAP